MIVVYSFVTLLTIILMVHIFIYVNDIDKQVKGLRGMVDDHFNKVEDTIEGATSTTQEKDGNEQSEG